MKPDDYRKNLQDNITTKYKKADPTTMNDIEEELTIITNKLDISERIDNTDPKPAFITLKDHKENFRTNPKVRLINPMKPKLGHATKQMLDRINKEIKKDQNQ